MPNNKIHNRAFLKVRRKAGKNQRRIQNQYNTRFVMFVYVPSCRSSTHSNVISNWKGLKKGEGLSSTTTFTMCTFAMLNLQPACYHAYYNTLLHTQFSLAGPCGRGAPAARGSMAGNVTCTSAPLIGPGVVSWSRGRWLVNVGGKFWILTQKVNSPAPHPRSAPASMYPRTVALHATVMNDSRSDCDGCCPFSHSLSGT